MQRINCNNDIQMVAENIRLPKLSLNQAMFQKTEHEKRVIKLQKGPNKPSETEKLFKEFLPYLMDEKDYTLNLKGFIAKDLVRIKRED